jgi:hypothetical protein
MYVFIPEEVAEASQIFFRDKNHLTVSNTADVAGSKPIAVSSQSISGVNAINHLITFYDIHGRERCYSFILSRTPHEAQLRSYEEYFRRL